jgi:hypothetical protein
MGMLCAATCLAGHLVSTGTLLEKSMTKQLTCATSGDSISGHQPRGRSQNHLGVKPTLTPGRSGTGRESGVDPGSIRKLARSESLFIVESTARSRSRLRFRVLPWMWVYLLVGSQMSGAFRARQLGALYLQARHIENHQPGEALARTLSDCSFPVSRAPRSSSPPTITFTRWTCSGCTRPSPSRTRRTGPNWNA